MFFLMDLTELVNSFTFLGEKIQQFRLESFWLRYRVVFTFKWKIGWADYFIIHVPMLGINVLFVIEKTPSPHNNSYKQQIFQHVIMGKYRIVKQRLHWKLCKF